MTFSDALSGYITLLSKLELLYSLPQEEYLRGISEVYDRMSNNGQKRTGQVLSHIKRRKCSRAEAVLKRQNIVTLHVKVFYFCCLKLGVHKP